MLRSWCRRLTRPAPGFSPRGERPAPRPRFRPAVEALDDRITPAVSYHGGPLLAHVEVENVFLGSAWNTDPTLQPQSQQLDGFAQFLDDSPYVSMLEQYSAGGQTITGGHWTGRDVFTGAVGGTVTDAQIQADLRAEIAAGRAQPTDANRLYVVYTPAGTVVQAFGTDSTPAGGFAGYHFHTTDAAGNPVYYAVIPYGGTPNYLHAGLTPFQQLTEVTSHELTEAITDPNNATGWYDSSGNEIGDIVNFQYAAYDGYIVQREWSNLDNRGILPGDRGAAANAFLGSSEYQGDFVAGLYSALLHRAASSGEVSSWVNAIRANGWTDEVVIGDFLSTTEYANLHGGGGNDSAWVQAVYQDELGRAAGGGEVAAWLPLVQSQGRAWVGAAIARSQEAEARVVGSYFEHYLHRAADPGGLANLTNLLTSGSATREGVQAVIVASNEYFDLQVRNTDGAHSTNKGFVDAVYLDVFGRSADPSGETAWVNYLRQGGG